MHIIFNEGSQQDTKSIDLATRAGTFINNVKEPERRPSVWSEVKNVHNNHSSAELMSQTSIYNCMGMIFASRRTSIDIEDWLEMILIEDEYRKLNSVQDALLGDIIVYERNEKLSHVGLLIEKNLTATSIDYIVLSQWGADGEWKHHMYDVPELLGNPSEFWTHRRWVHDL